MKTYRVKLVMFEAMEKHYECLVEVPDDFNPDDEDTSITSMAYFSADLDEDFEVGKSQWELVAEHAEEIVSLTEEDKKLDRWRLPADFDKDDDDFDCLEKVEGS